MKMAVPAALTVSSCPPELGVATWVSHAQLRKPGPEGGRRGSGALLVQLNRKP